jgi:preprotein translocase subunit SecG
VDTLRIIVTVLYVLICIALTIVVIMQEGKSAGLGAISGMAETYWGKNKGRSIEGKLELATKILAVLFIVISLVLNMNW